MVYLRGKLFGMNKSISRLHNFQWLPRGRHYTLGHKLRPITVVISGHNSYMTGFFNYMVKRLPYLRGDIIQYVLSEFVSFNPKFHLLITLTHMKGFEWAEFF